MTTMKTKIFFSGNVAPKGPLQTFCETAGWELTAKSLLQFGFIPFTIQQPFDVMFFSSPRSVNYFFNYQSVRPETAIACVGSGTAAVLRQLDITPDFIGSKSGDPEAVALEFQEWLGERRVLFPVSKRSNETISSVIPDQKKEVVVCYETILAPGTIALHDYYVFTSPSNVESFLLKNAFPVDKQIIAWGKTTDKKIVGLGFKSNFVLDESSEQALVEILQSR